MALSERSRNTIYRQLTPTLGEEATAEMLSYFPARDVEEPTTKEQLDLLRAELRAEIADLRTELRGDMAELRTELRGDMAEQRSELHTGLAAVRIDMERQFNKMTLWLAGSVFTAAGLVVAAIRLGS